MNKENNSYEDFAPMMSIEEFDMIDKDLKKHSFSDEYIRRKEKIMNEYKHKKTGNRTQSIVKFAAAAAALFVAAPIAVNAATDGEFFQRIWGNADKATIESYEVTFEEDGKIDENGNVNRITYTMPKVEYTEIDETRAAELLGDIRLLSVGTAGREHGHGLAEEDVSEWIHQPPAPGRFLHLEKAVSVPHIHDGPAAVLIYLRVGGGGETADAFHCVRIVSGPGRCLHILLALHLVRVEHIGGIVVTIAVIDDGIYHGDDHILVLIPVACGQGSQRGDCQSDGFPIHNVRCFRPATRSRRHGACF